MKNLQFRKYKPSLFRKIFRTSHEKIVQSEILIRVKFFHWRRISEKIAIFLRLMITSIKHLQQKLPDEFHRKDPSLKKGETLLLQTKSCLLEKNVEQVASEIAVINGNRKLNFFSRCADLEKVSPEVGPPKGSHHLFLLRPQRIGSFDDR